MPFISVTRLRIRKLRFMPGFALHAVRSFQQTRGAAGFVKGAVLQDRKLTFWTLTAWDAQQSMRDYMTSGHHKTAMPHLVSWCDEASVVHWEQDSLDLPDWTEAERRMRTDGRPSKIRHPSSSHADLSFAAARTTAGAPITPLKALPT